MAFDAQSFVASDSGSTSQSVGHTASGSSRYVLVFVIQWSDVAITSMTYGGVSMGDALHREIGTATGRVVTAYGMIEPATGVQTVQVTFAATPTVSALCVVSYTDVNQDTPVTAVDGEHNDSASPISSAVGSAGTDTVVAVGYMSSNPMSAGLGQTARITQNNFADLVRSLMVSDKVGASPTQTMSYECADTFEDNIIISVSLQASEGGGGGQVSNQNFMLLGIG